MQGGDALNAGHSFDIMQIVQKFISPFRELITYKDLLVQLVSRDLKLKYRRSFLGYLWSVLSPLMIMAVQAVVFSQIFKRGITNYPVYLLSGQILFNYMNQSTHMAIHSIIDSRELIKKVYLPKFIFTVSKITSGLIDLIFSMGALIIVILCTFNNAGRITWHFLLFPIVLIQLYIFCLGLGLFLAAATVFFRDVQYIYSVVTTAWLYLTPIFYRMEDLPEYVQAFIRYCNPMMYYVVQFRSIVYYHTLPSLQHFLAGMGAALLVLLLGSLFFTAKQDDFILYV